MKKGLINTHKVLCVMLSSVIALTGCSFNQSATTKASVGDMTVDLINYQTQLMQTHPLLESGDLKDEIIDDFAKLRKDLTSDMDTDDVVWQIKKIISKLGDEHTHINITAPQNMLPIRFEYVSDGLVAIDNFGSIKKGDVILALGHKDIQVILNELRNVTAKDLENVLHGGIVPSHLHTESYLEHLGLINDNNSVEVTYLDKDNLTQSVALNLSKQNWPETDIYEYEFDSISSTGVFVIRNYMNRSKFEKVWAAFIEECRIKQPENILIDVRKSTGGFSEYHMTDAIFSSLGIKEYKTPYPEYYKDAFKKTETVNVTRHFDPISVKNLYVATSNYTISAPTIFAATVKENSFGTIIGQPVANNLDFYASGSYAFEHMPIQAGIGGYYLDYEALRLTQNHH